MPNVYEATQALIEALAAEGIDRRTLEDYEADQLTRIGRMRGVRDRAIRDMEAARLLPLGLAVVMEIQGCCKATVYNRNKRATKSKQSAVG
jgi:hypothetical protein